MLSLNPFCCIIFVASAFATVASAIPFLMKRRLIDADEHTNVDSQLEKGLVDADTYSNLDAQLKRKLIDSNANANVDSQLKRGLIDADTHANVDAQLKRSSPSYSPADVFKKCHDGIAPIVVKIEAAVKVGGGAKYVDHGLVIDLLREIAGVLEVALGELKLIDVKAELLLLNGVACTLKELAGIVAGLLIPIIEVVWLVLTVVDFNDPTICGVIVNIGGLLRDLLKLVLALDGGLLVEVVVLIEPYGDHCKHIKYTGLLDLLGIRL